MKPTILIHGKFSKGKQSELKIIKISTRQTGPELDFDGLKVDFTNQILINELQI